MVSLTRLPKTALALFEKLPFVGKYQPLDSPWHPDYQPQHLSHVIQIQPDRQVELKAIIYLPGAHGTGQTQVQLRVGKQPWRSLSPYPPDPDYWHLDLDELREGQPLSFRY